MLPVTTLDEVKKRMRTELDEADDDYVNGLIEEATIIVDGYLGGIPTPVPRAVQIVAARMVARVLESPDDGHSISQRSYTAGPFTENLTYRTGASGGAPWMTAVDRKALRRYRRRGGIYSVEMG